MALSAVSDDAGDGWLTDAGIASLCCTDLPAQDVCKSHGRGDWGGNSPAKIGSMCLATRDPHLLPHRHVEILSEKWRFSPRRSIQLDKFATKQAAAPCISRAAKRIDCLKRIP